MDLFPNEVYVFTPRGDVKEFPRGATPIDFAYAIHTEVGHHCAGAKVNGRMVPLRYELQNGDVVEIITSPQHVPSRDWLKIARTSRARARIRAWINTEEREKSLALGKDLCAREFKKFRMDFSGFVHEHGEEVAKRLSFKSLEDLLVAVGYGKISPVQVRRAARRILNPEPERPELPPTGEPAAKRAPKDTGIRIHGVDDIMIHLAKCCTPVPGDDVVGYITRGRGVTVHRTDCKNLQALDPERKVEVSWGPEPGETYPVRLRVQTLDQKGMLAAVSNAISGAEANIVEAKVVTSPDQTAIFNFVVEVTDGAHLQRILSGIRKLDGVNWVERVAAT